MGDGSLEMEVLERVAERLRCMGHPVRLMILGALKGKEMAVTNLAERLELPVAVVSQHLRALEQGVLLKSRRDGRSRFYSIHAPMAEDICQIICAQIEHDLSRMSAEREVFERLKSRLQG